jgi:hypothetical protein
MKLASHYKYVVLEVPLSLMMGTDFATPDVNDLLESESNGDHRTD